MRRIYLKRTGFGAQDQGRGARGGTLAGRRTSGFGAQDQGRGARGGTLEGRRIY